MIKTDADPELAELAPKGNARLGANPHANGGLLLKDLRLPDFRDYGIEVQPGKTKAQDMIELGGYIRDIFKLNEENKNFRIFGPDESMSNRLYKVFEYQKRDWNAEMLDTDDCLARDGRIMDSMLSEHMCEGWLEGYLLTGRHGFFASYEAFIRIVDSMAAQHAKWLKVCNQLSWRQPIASLNFILTSNVWQQDHNGFTHQDPGFLDHIANKKADVVRMYLPPDANCLLSCFDHCIKSKNYVNAIVASKHPSCQWLTMEQAVKHCTQVLVSGSGQAMTVVKNQTLLWPAAVIHLHLRSWLQLLSFVMKCRNLRSVLLTLSTCSNWNLTTNIHTA